MSIPASFIQSKVTPLSGKPFHKQPGTSIINAQNAKLEKLFLLRKEVLAIDPNAMQKKDVVKLAEYAYALCGLSKKERISVVFDGEQKIKERPADYVPMFSGPPEYPTAVRNASADVLRRTLGFVKWNAIKTNGDSCNPCTFCYRYSGLPEIKMLALRYNLESIMGGLHSFDNNIFDRWSSRNFGAIHGSSEKPERIFWSETVLLIVNELKLKDENPRRDRDYLGAILMAERKLVPGRSSNNLDILLAGGPFKKDIQEIYLRLDSLKAIAEKILGS